MSEELRHACHKCGQHIAYPPDAAGAVIQCPNCSEETTLGESYPEQPVLPSPTKTWRVTEIPPSEVKSAPLSFESQSIKPSQGRIAPLTIVVICILATALTGVFVVIKNNANKAAAAELKAKEESERLKAEVEKAKQEAATAKRQAEDAERAKAAAKAAEEAKQARLATEEAKKMEAARLETEAKVKQEAERFAKLKASPSVMALWEEPDHDAIQITSTRETDAIVRHNGKSFTVKNSEMPGWLMEKAKAIYREDGEAKGMYREVAGKIYDLRTSPPGWVSIASARVIQVWDSGQYLMVNEATSGAFSVSVFMLKHNGLARVLNENDRMQVMGMSAGTFTYRSKGGDNLTVPVYDPGMPVGPMREKVVPFRQ